MPGRRRLLAAAGAVTAAAVVAAAPASAAILKPTPNVTAVDARGRTLPQDPVLHLHQRISIIIRGFQPRAHVFVRTAGKPDGLYATANPRGVLTFPFTAGAHASKARFVLTFVGAPPAGPPSRPARGGRGDNQVVTVTVPTIGLFPYRVGSQGSGAGGQNGGNPSGPGTGPAHTGFDVVGWLRIAAILFALGGVLLELARRRSQLRTAA